MLIAILLFVGLSLTILIHEAGHFLVAKYFNLKVEEFGFGFPPRLFAWRRGETEYSFNWLPFGGFVRIYGENSSEIKDDLKRSFAFQPVYVRSAIIIAGVVMNFLLGWFLISSIFMIGTPSTVIISGVQENSPAMAAGLEEGDMVLDFPNVGNFIEYINQNQGEEVSIKVLRGSETIEISAVPRVNPPKGEGALGVALVDAGIPRQGFFGSIWGGFLTSITTMWLIVLRFFGLLKDIFIGGEGLELVVGPVGVFGVAQQLGRIGLIYVVQLIAMISLNLAIFNIFPFPALDGGRLFFVLIEKLKGSPLPQKFEQVTNLVGFALLFALMIAITVQDVSKLL